MDEFCYREIIVKRDRNLNGPKLMNQYRIHSTHLPSHICIIDFIIKFSTLIFDSAHD